VDYVSVLALPCVLQLRAKGLVFLKKKHRCCDWFPS